MPAIEIGRVCVKTRGRESGRKCVIVDVMGKNFVLVTGPKELTGVRRRKANIGHIEPLNVKVDIKRGASDDDIIKALEKAGVIQQMKIGLKPKIR